MSSFTRFLSGALISAAVLASPVAAPAADTDGGNDCSKPMPTDFGDAPENILAYPGVIGSFPTCLAAGPVGTQDTVCAAISTAPGVAGFVRHVNPLGGDHYWLNCSPGADFGIDSEADAKVNDNGGNFSACNANIMIDCVQAAFGINFGQDDCLGGTDAGIDPPPQVLVACSTGVVEFRTMNCDNAPRSVYLNVLIDMNEDGDWNDNFLCGTDCAYEWALKNVIVTLGVGCSMNTSPTFPVGPNPGNSWLRISLSDGPVPDDFAWNGSAGIAGQSLSRGETEDYPIRIRPTAGDSCMTYEDFGDAPEGIAAYPSGTIGHFPTCAAPSLAGSQTLVCAPVSAVPGTTGHVRHVSPAGAAYKLWLGCASSIPGSVDGEADGKVNATGLGGSECDSAVVVDCAESAFGGTTTFGQDECWGDFDAGVVGPVAFQVCATETLVIEANNCRGFTHPAYLNVLVDWNEDGDWNDNFECDSTTCAYEWSVINRMVPLAPGCNTIPVFLLAGPNAGFGWMRVTITEVPVPGDFPWAGSAGAAGGFFVGGETEDYPVTIESDAVGVGSAALPSGFAFAALSPNPSATSTSLRYRLPHAGEVSVVAYDVSGRLVRRLVKGSMGAGEHRETWDFRDDKGRTLPAGVYFVQLRLESHTITRRVIRVN